MTPTNRRLVGVTPYAPPMILPKSHRTRRFLSVILLFLMVTVPWFLFSYTVTGRWSDFT